MHTEQSHPSVARSAAVRDERRKVTPVSEHDPELHYDRVMPAWRLLLGRNLHYGYFTTLREDLDEATDQLTRRMASYARLGAGLEVLDVGCGDGQTSCFLAQNFGCRIVGITTGKKGVAEARALAQARRLTRTVKFEHRDGMDNGFPDASFDRVWVMQSSHFMLDKRRLLDECVRVLRPGGRFALSDIVLRTPTPMIDVVTHRDEFLLLHRVFGRAKMESLELYQSLADASGLRLDVVEDVSANGFPTMNGWRRNAIAHKEQAINLLGETMWRDFLAACDVMERFWTEGRYGYAILAGAKK